MMMCIEEIIINEEYGGGGFLFFFFEDESEVTLFYCPKILRLLGFCFIITLFGMQKDNITLIGRLVFFFFK